MHDRGDSAVNLGGDSAPPVGVGPARPAHVPTTLAPTRASGANPRSDSAPPVGAGLAPPAHVPTTSDSPRAPLRPGLRLAAALALAFAAIACTGKDWRVQQLYGGPTSMEVLAAPQSVEAFRIDPRLPAPNRDAPRLGDFNILRGPVAVDAATTAEISAILRDPDTYDWWRAKGCDFRPGVGLRLVKNASRIEIALCFECDELMVFRHGRRVNMEDFDAARPRLVAVVKRLFPDDPEIQALR